jgi:hypothetical protein
MDIGDFTGLGKPATKLLDMIGKGIGRVYSDTIGVKFEANRIKAIGEAKNAVKSMALESLPSLEKRANSRIDHVEAVRQKNIEDIVALSYNYLPETASEESTDQDWIARFFNSVQDISDNQLKDVWAKILAGEVKKAGSFSLRTLDTLRNLSHDEAKLFSKACEFVVTSAYLLKLGAEFTYTKYGLNHHDLMVLCEAGLLLDTDSVQSKPDFEGGTPILFKDKLIYLEPNKETTFTYELLALTKAGKELYKILDIKVNEEFYSDAMIYYKNKGYVLREIKANSPELINLFPQAFQ